jgi:hypothetical protein
MERFQYELTSFQSELLISESRIAPGLFLCVLHADKVPPHLGLISNGLFYSLKANSKDNGVPVGHLLQIVDRRNIATLFFEVPRTLSNHAEIKCYFENAPAQIIEDQTCLSPIKMLFKAPSSVNQIGDLMRFLEQSKLVLARLTMHLPEDFKGIPFYTLNEITKRIEALKYDKGQKSIS